MCPTSFCRGIYERPYEVKSILLASFLNSNCNRNSHTNHGVVAGTDQTHHLYVKGAVRCKMRGSIRIFQ
jgi:hypothetical protein